MTPGKYEDACEALRFIQECLDEYYGIDEEPMPHTKPGLVSAAESGVSLLLSAWPELKEKFDDDRRTKTP